MISSGRFRWLHLLGFGVLSILVVSFISLGCSRGDDDDGGADDVQVEMQVTPDPPEAGPAVIEVVLRDGDDEPINGAELEIEGNMSHAGMQPVIVDAGGEQDGRYASDGFEFTMGGDWIITVRGTLPDGSEIERTFDLKGVAS